MTTTEINTSLPHTRGTRKKVSAILLAALALFTLSTATAVFAQNKFSKTYPARKNIRIHLNNWSGSIEVEGWAKDQIKISAEMEAPAARFTPKMDGESLLIDVVRDNQGRGDIGSVNFKVSVPTNSTVDIETRFGDLTVNNVQGSMVRAHISSEGNISLTQIRSSVVMARNVTGDILFDGELMSGGVYTLQSTGGNINIRIPENSAFRLVANAPTRNITLGSFANSGLSFLGDGRKVVGNVGDGRASLSVMNQRGYISFIRR
jgi:hypothetical protein